MADARVTLTDLGDGVTADVVGVTVTLFAGTGVVQTVVAGANVAVDSTDPAHPIVSATGGGGGGGAVDSVNGHTGVVVLAASDVGADASGAAAAAQAAAIAASQPLDSDLTAIAALTTTTFGRALLTLADAAALRTSAGLGTAAVAASTDFDAAGAAAAAQAASQPLDSDLTAIAALSTTTYGRSLLISADAAALRTAAGLGTAATQAATAFDASGAAAAAQAASQPLDSDLTAIAALSTTSFGRSFLALADAAAGRTLLGLGTLATQSGTFSGTSSGTNTGDQTVTLTGDVTGSGTGSFAATLASTAVTPGSYGDASHSLAATVDTKGRLTALAANSIAIPESAVTNLTTDLAAKAAVLTRTVVKTGNYTAVLGDLVPCDTSGGAFTVTLPAASGGKGRIVVKLVTAGNTLNLALTGSDHFNTSAGPTTGTLTLANQGLILESDGSSIWTISADDLPLSVLDARYVLDSVVTTKGDLLVATGSGVVARRGVGTSGQVLTVDSTQTDGVAWVKGAPPMPYRIATGSSLYHVMPGNATTRQPTVNKLRCHPFPVDIACTFTSLSINVQAAVASSTFRLGIYNDDGGGRPGTLLLDAGTVATTSTGLAEVTISQAMTPGLYWLASAQQGGASAVTVYGRTDGMMQFLVKLAGSPINAIAFGHDGYDYNGTVSGALPSPWLFLAVGDPETNIVPTVAVKVS